MDFTSDEKDLLVRTCQELGSKPKFDNKEDFINWMREYLSSQASESVSSEGTKATVDTVKHESSTVKPHLPRVPIFSGSVPMKADHVPYEVWNYELQCLLQGKQYSPEAILNAARLSLRGEASRVAVRLGTEATITELMDKMKRLYGSVEVGHQVLANFYSATQNSDESVVQWSFRLEELMDQAIQSGQFKRAESQEALRSKFWNGLKPALKDLSGHKFDTIQSYETLLVEMRKLEATTATDLTRSNTKLKTVSSKVNQMQTARTDMKHSENAVAAASTSSMELTSMIQQLQAQVHNMSAKMDQLERNAASASQQRKKPTCWRCGKLGHTQSVCRNTSLPLNGFRSTPGGMWGPSTPKPQ